MQRNVNYDKLVAIKREFKMNLIEEFLKLPYYEQKHIYFLMLEVNKKRRLTCEHEDIEQPTDVCPLCGYSPMMESDLTEADYEDAYSWLINGKYND